jgi:pyridoxamine 5'-phosphate oxidase family protein
MSVFTPEEIDYLASQRLGRLATINPAGRPQNAPVGFRYNPGLDTIDIGGRDLVHTQKYRNILQNPNVAFVVDDVLPPWRPRGIEIRGTVQVVSTGGKSAFNEHFGEAMLRITPFQIIGWGVYAQARPPFNRKVHPVTHESS